MRELTRSALIATSPAQLYALIDDIDSYPAFVPWCTRAVVESRTAQEVVATLGVRRGVLTTEFTTRNRLDPPHRITMELERGPFRVLSGLWTLTPIGRDGCRIELAMRFAFANPVTAAVFEPLFEETAGSLVDAFVARAKAIDGAR
jgi:ribosome-associated toxin RatA of RatAB toxin-antitoxin module